MMTTKLASKTAIIFFSVLILTLFVYWPGLSGRFYFDDYGNLSALSAHGGVKNIETFLLFVFGGTSGPSGRPLSLLSFLINDNSWPSSPFSFKYTNLLIHLIIGCLLFWAAFLISETQKNIWDERKRLLVSVFVLVFWILNPMHTSTVFYAVQRMAQLSTLFVVLGLVFYLKGRLCLEYNKQKAYILMLTGVGVCTVLAVLSKENGALLPSLILALEAAFFSSAVRAPLNRGFKYIFLWAPTAIIILFVLYKVFENGFFNVYPTRDFSPWQRLITEPWIMIVYLKECFLPSLYTPGLYFDQIKHFESIMNVKAIISSAFVLLISAMTFLFLKKKPLVLFPLAFFLVGHFIESTALNLELYFEHRNYLPSLFLGFLAFSIVDKVIKKRKELGGALVIVLLGAYSLIAYHRSDLWGKPVEHAAYIAESNPYSDRAQIERANALVRTGMQAEAMDFLSDAVERKPESIPLAMQAVLVDCIDGDLQEKRSDHLLSLAEKNTFDARMSLVMEEIWRHMEKGTCARLSPFYVKKLLNAFNSGEGLGRDEGSQSKKALDMYSYRWEIQFSQDKGFRDKILKDLLLYEDPEAHMRNASLFASMGYYESALKLAYKARVLVENGNLGDSSRTAKNFGYEIDVFIKTVKSDLRESNEHESIGDSSRKK